MIDYIATESFLTKKILFWHTYQLRPFMYFMHIQYSKLIEAKSFTNEIFDKNIYNIDGFRKTGLLSNWFDF